MHIVLNYFKCKGMFNVTGRVAVNSREQGEQTVSSEAYTLDFKMVFHVFLNLPGSALLFTKYLLLLLFWVLGIELGTLDL